MTTATNAARKSTAIWNGVAIRLLLVGVRSPGKAWCEFKKWSGRRASNPLPQPWQGCALPSELLPHPGTDSHPTQSTRGSEVLAALEVAGDPRPRRPLKPEPGAPGRRE